MTTKIDILDGIQVKGDGTLYKVAELIEDLKKLKRDQQKLEARFVDLKSRFDGQGGTLAESARWIESTMAEFETKVEKTLSKYKGLLENLSAFDFGARLERLEEASTRQEAAARRLRDAESIERAERKLVVDRAAKEATNKKPGFFSKLLGKKKEDKK